MRSPSPLPREAASTTTSSTWPTLPPPRRNLRSTKRHPVARIRRSGAEVSSATRMTWSWPCAASSPKRVANSDAVRSSRRRAGREGRRSPSRGHTAQGDGCGWDRWFPRRRRRIPARWMSFWSASGWGQRQEFPSCLGDLFSCYASHVPLDVVSTIWIEYRRNQGVI